MSKSDADVEEDVSSTDSSSESDCEPAITEVLSSAKNSVSCP